MKPETIAAYKGFAQAMRDVVESFIIFLLLTEMLSRHGAFP